MNQPHGFTSKEAAQTFCKTKLPELFPHAGRKNIKWRLDIWKSFLTGSDQRSWHSCCLRVLHRAPGRTALPSTASDWLLISISPSFNILKKSQVKAFSHFFSQEFPKYFTIYLIHHLGVGFGFLGCCHCSVTSQVREDCCLTALLMWFPLLLTSLQKHS